MKRIYISGALMGATRLQDVKKLYEDFATACREAGWIPYIPHTNTDPETAAELTAGSVVAKDLDELNEADAVLAYLGEPSLGAGTEIAMAISQRKPVLAVWERERKVSRFIVGLLEQYDRSSLFRFGSPVDACNWIRQRLSK